MKAILLATAVFLSALTPLQVYSTPTFSEWLRLQERRSFSRLMKMIESKSDKQFGSVIASPSRNDPNYFYHWVRDAALVVDPLVTVFTSTKQAELKQRIFNVLHAYVVFSTQLQATAISLPAGLGEPKFHPNGQAFTEPWGRPQTDGPALRAGTLVPFALHLLALDKADYVQGFLYDPWGFQPSLIKRDLDYLVDHWQDRTFDLWEEVKGHHFYTRLMQLRALEKGAQLAKKLNDADGARHYSHTASKIRASLNEFWSGSKRRIVPTLDAEGGADKERGIDTAVLLGSLHLFSHASDSKISEWSPADDRMLSTAFYAVQTFKRIYAINEREDWPGVALGRYPEDRYDGHKTESIGNPWFLTTMAMGQFCYLAAEQFKKVGTIKLNSLNLPFWIMILGRDLVGNRSVKTESLEGRELLQALVKFGDGFLGRVALHASQTTGEMSEQINRTNGFMQGAENLSWNYAAFLTAFWRRPR